MSRLTELQKHQNGFLGAVREREGPYFDAGLALGLWAMEYPELLDEWESLLLDFAKP